MSVHAAGEASWFLVDDLSDTSRTAAHSASIDNLPRVPREVSVQRAQSAEETSTPAPMNTGVMKALVLVDHLREERRSADDRRLARLMDDGGSPSS